MKKASLVILIFLGLSVSLCAQEKKKSRFQLGPSIGLNLGAAIPIPLRDIPKGAKGTPDLNSSLGVFTWYELNDKWSIGTGFDLSKNSFSFNADVVSQKYISTSPITGKKQTLYYTGPTTGDFRFNYWSFPVQAKYEFSSLYQATFGIYASWVYFHRFNVVAVGGKTGLNPDPAKQNPIPRVEYNFDNDLSSFDLGLVGGVQRKILKNLYFGLKLELGAFDVFKKGFDSITYKLYPIQLEFGLTYNLL